MKFDVLASLSATPSLRLLRFLVRSGKFAPRQEFSLLVTIFSAFVLLPRWVFHTAIRHMSRPRVRRNRVTVSDVAPHARHQNHTSPCDDTDCVPTIAPWQPLPRQHGTTDRVIRDTDVGPTCGVRDAPVVTTAMAKAPPWPQKIPLRHAPMTTEDWNRHFQILLKS